MSESYVNWIGMLLRNCCRWWILVTSTFGLCLVASGLSSYISIVGKQRLNSRMRIIEQGKLWQNSWWGLYGFRASMACWVAELITITVFWARKDLKLQGCFFLRTSTWDFHCIAMCHAVSFPWMLAADIVVVHSYNDVESVSPSRYYPLISTSIVGQHFYKVHHHHHWVDNRSLIWRHGRFVCSCFVSSATSWPLPDTFDHEISRICSVCETWRRLFKTRFTILQVFWSHDKRKIKHRLVLKSNEPKK